MAESGDNSPSADTSLSEDSDVVELTEEIAVPAVDEEKEDDGERTEVQQGETGNGSDNDPDDTPDGCGVTFQEAPTTDRLSQEALNQALKQDAGDQTGGGGYDRQEMVKTARMDAVPRKMADLSDGGDEIGAMLTGSKFAPQVIAAPPSVLVKKWQEGLPGSVERIVVSETGDDAVSSAGEESDVEELDNDDVEEIELNEEDVEEKPASAAAPPGEPPPKRPRTAPAAAAPDQQEVAEANQAARDPEMTGLVQELLEEEEQKKKQKELGPRQVWFHNVFNEEYLRSLPENITPITEKEVDFMEASLRLKKNSRILDLACGFGRHSLEMANRGYEMVGLDLSRALLERAVEEADKRSLSIKFIHGDMRELSFSKIFDGCIFWNTSLGYFDDQTNLGVLRGIQRALKAGGRLLVDVVNRDHVVKQTPTRLWWEGNGCIFLEETEFEHQTSTLRTSRSYIYEDGTPPLEQTTFIRLYNVHELRQMLHVAGFKVLEVSGDRHYKGYFLGPASKRIIILAEKRG